MQSGYMQTLPNSINAMEDESTIGIVTYGMALELILHTSTLECLSIQLMEQRWL